MFFGIKVCVFDRLLVAQHTVWGGGLAVAEGASGGGVAGNVCLGENAGFFFILKQGHVVVVV